MRALFLTAGGLISAKVLSAWIAFGHSVAAVWVGSLEPRQFLRRDRALGFVAPSWSTAAIAHHFRIPVCSNPKLSSWKEAEAEIRRLNPDVLITSLTRQIVPANLLQRFEGRAVNFHPALLPHYRGPNPRSGMILDGTARLYGGVTAHVLSREVDAGDIIGLRPTPYDADRGFVDWNVRQAFAAGDLVKSELQDYLNGVITPTPQRVDTGSYRKVQPSELALTERLSAERIEWLCRHLGASGWIHFYDSSGEKSYSVSRFIHRIGRPCSSPSHNSVCHRIRRFGRAREGRAARAGLARAWELLAGSRERLERPSTARPFRGGG